MSSKPVVRRITEADLKAIQTLFYKTYGDSYPYKEFYSDHWLKRSIYQDSYLSLLAEVDGQVVGTASVYFEVGAYADLCGEFGRLAVDPEARGYGVGAALMQARLEFAERRLHFGLAECRSAHPYAQRISHKFGLMPLGFLPQKVLLEKRESLVMTGRAFGVANELRRNHPRVIPEVYLLGQAALQNLGFRADLIAVDEPDGYEIGSGFEVAELEEEGLPSLLRIERGRLSSRKVFGNLQLTYGLFMLQSKNSRYLVANDKGRIVGAIGFTVDTIGRSIKVVELVSLRDDVSGFLLKELDRRARQQYQAEYVEITVSAYEPDIQRTLSNLGFVPVAYCPSLVFHQVERLDTVKLAKVYVPLDIDDVALTEEAEVIYRLVRKGFEDKRLGMEVTEATREMSVFRGLEEGELERIAGLCHVRRYGAGEVLVRAGERGEYFYMVLEGRLDVLAEGGQVLGHIEQGDFLGEISLVLRQGYGATAVSRTPVKIAALKYDDFEQLINRYPRIGLHVMRNIAISMGQRIGAVNERLVTLTALRDIREAI
jgi:GNAT superfamily N-acetyltransferase